jgi:hypothetical protein
MFEPRERVKEDVSMHTYSVVRPLRQRDANKAITIGNSVNMISWV